MREEAAGLGTATRPLVFVALVLACPSCPTAQVVQRAVFDERFLGFLTLTLLPLLVLSVIVSLLYRIGDTPK